MANLFFFNVNLICNIAQWPIIDYGPLNLYVAVIIAFNGEQRSDYRTAVRSQVLPNSFISCVCHLNPKACRLTNQLLWRYVDTVFHVHLTSNLQAKNALCVLSWRFESKNAFCLLFHPCPTILRRNPRSLQAVNERTRLCSAMRRARRENGPDQDSLTIVLLRSRTMATAKTNGRNSKRPRRYKRKCGQRKRGQAHTGKSKSILFQKSAVWWHDTELLPASYFNTGSVH